MKRHLALAGFFAAAVLAATAESYLLELETSSDNQSWVKSPIDPNTITGAGDILTAADQDRAFYRLRIRTHDSDGIVPVLGLGQVPEMALKIALEFLRSFEADEEQQNRDQDPEDLSGLWPEGVTLGPLAFPIYDLAVDGGRSPAYIEFKVVQDQAAAQAMEDSGEFRADPPQRELYPLGYIKVALTRSDFPVAQFSNQGRTPAEELLRRARTTGPIRLLRFDEGFLVAEDSQGKMVGSLGNVPFAIASEALALIGDEWTGDDGDGEARVDPHPEFEISPYATYQDLKQDYLESPVLKAFRSYRALAASAEWDLTLELELETLLLPAVQQAALLFREEAVEAAHAANEEVLEVLEATENGLWVRGLDHGGSLLTVRFGDGSVRTFVVLVGESGAFPQQAFGWTNWSYWWAGNSGNQRRYRQYQNDPLMCPGGASGCGPTAWAMLFGWWDRQGSPRLIKELHLADSPLNNDWSVLQCSRGVFNHVGPWCVSGQAATMPWNMANGRRWAWDRGAGGHISWSWGVPYVSPGSVSRGRQSVQNGRPSILGIGFYWHYVLAWGYAHRHYRMFGVNVSTSRWFYCNMGWGGSNHSEWRSSSSVWFATHAQYW